MSQEIHLPGGRVTPGVVRIGETVRRPTNPNSAFVHELLLHLERVGFDGAPRFLGIDEEGREILSFHEGHVPDDLRPDCDDETLRAAALLLRAYHDATSGFAALDDSEVVCHNDISPPNTVFAGEAPVALIDFDAAAPGPRLREVAYGLLLWIDLGNEHHSLTEQGRRAQVFLEAYGLSPSPADLVGAMIARQRETVESLRDGSEEMVAWWSGRADWLATRRPQFEEVLA